MNLLLPRNCFQTQRIQRDEAGGVVLVVGLFLAAFHGGDGFGVHAVRGAAAGLHDVAFVEFQFYFTGNFFLGFGDEGLDGFAFWGEPETVVNELRVFRDEGIADVHGFAIDDEGFEVAVSGEEDGAAWGFVNAAGFHADESVLYDIDAAYAVATTEEVEHTHDAVGGKDGVAVTLAGGFDVAELGKEGIKVGVFQTDGIAFFKKDFDVFCLVRSFFWGNGKDVHVAVFGSGGVIPWVFHSAGFEGDVEEVPIHGVRLFHGSFNRDVVGLGVGDHFGAAGELFAEFCVAPWGDAFDVRREGGSGEFKTDLVVAFSGGAVGDGIGSLGDGDFDHVCGDAGAGDGSAEQVAAFIDRASLDHGEDVVFREVLFEIADVAFGSAGGEGFGFEAIEFVALADICAVGDDFRVVFLFEPEEEN